MKLFILQSAIIIAFFSGCGESSNQESSTTQALNPSALPQEIGQTPLFPSDLKDI